MLLISRANLNQNQALSSDQNLAMEAFGFFLLLLLLGFVSADTSFIYNGFHHANLSLDGVSSVKSNGLLAMTNDSLKLLGHAFYPSPLLFKQPNANNKKSTVVTFSTNFVISIIPEYPNLGGNGLAFVLMSTKDPKGCLANQFLGLPNGTGKAESSSTGRILAVEFDVGQNPEFNDIDDNHVGIDICSLISSVSHTAQHITTPPQRTITTTASSHSRVEILFKRGLIIIAKRWLSMCRFLLLECRGRIGL